MLVVALHPLVARRLRPALREQEEVKVFRIFIIGIVVGRGGGGESATANWAQRRVDRECGIV